MTLERAAMLGSAGILLSLVCWAQQSPPSVDQLLDKYVEAVGGTEKYASISTWYEKREVSGDLGLIPAVPCTDSVQVTWGSRKLLQGAEFASLVGAKRSE